MRDFFTSKFFIWLSACVIILVGVPSILSAMGQASFVREAVGLIFTPAEKAFNYVANGFEGYISYFTEYDRLKSENEIMRAQIEEYEKEIFNAELLTEDNAWLRSYLGLKREHIDYKFEAASVIGYEAGNYISIFTLDRGKAHGIEVGMPVLINTGLVGKVSETGLTWCKVSTILDASSSVGAYVKRSAETGLLEGDFSLKEDGHCKLSYLNFGADVKVGDKVYSSGLGSVYPRDLYIGEVCEITGDEYSRDKIAIVAPAVDFTKLTDVMILLDFEVYNADEFADVTDAADSANAADSAVTEQ